MPRSFIRRAIESSNLQAGFLTSPYAAQARAAFSHRRMQWLARFSSGGIKSSVTVAVTVRGLHPLPFYLEPCKVRAPKSNAKNLHRGWQSSTPAKGCQFKSQDFVSGCGGRFGGLCFKKLHYLCIYVVKWSMCCHETSGKKWQKMNGEIVNLWWKRG